MAQLQHQEVDALRRQVGGSNYLSDLRYNLFGSSRRSEMNARLGRGGNTRTADAINSFISEATNSSSPNRQSFLENDSYLIAAIQSIPNLVAYYPLNESSGSTARDFGPSGLNGTTTGATVGQEGKTGRAYSFDGTGDIVSIDDHTSLDLTTNFSGFCIANPTDFGEGNAGRMIDKENGSSTGYSFIVISTNSTLRLIKDGSTTVAANNDTVETGIWQMFGFSYDGSNVHFFKNGSSAGSPANTTNASANTAALTIGARAAGDRDFKGKLQHVGLVNRVMTATEHLRLARIAGLA